MTGKDWLNPSVLLEAFEARSARMAVGCAMHVAEAPDSELGECFMSTFTDLVCWTGWFLSLRLFTQQSDVI
jgi:hypothetical protein